MRPVTSLCVHHIPQYWRGVPDTCRGAHAAARGQDRGLQERETEQQEAKASGLKTERDHQAFPQTPNGSNLLRNRTSVLFANGRSATTADWG